MFARRPADGGIHPDKFQARAAYGEYTIDDGTGLVMTTPVALTQVMGSPVALGAADQVTQAAIAAAALTVVRSGLYEVFFHLNEITGVNAQALVASIEVNRAAAGFVEPSSLSPVQARIVDKLTQPATALAIVGLHGSGFLNLLKGDVVALFASASTGNLTSKRAHWGIRQVTDTSEQA